MKEEFEKLKKWFGELQKKAEDDEEVILHYEGHSLSYEFLDGRKDAFKEAQKIVSEVEAEYGNGWIDVKDRLPEKDGYYLTCDHKGNIHVFFHSQEFKETAPFGICEHHSRYYQPIAWMELPKPYTGKKGV